MPRRLLNNGQRPVLWENCLAALVIGMSGYFSRELLSLNSHEQLLLWLPSGLALGLLLRTRRAHLPGLIIGLLLANCHDGALNTLVATTRGLTECLLGIYLLRRKYWSSEFRRVKDIALFVVNGILLVSCVGKGFEIVVHSLFGMPLQLDGPALLELWARMAGIGLCVPAITLFNSEEFSLMSRNMRIKVLAILCLGPAAVQFQLAADLHPATQGYPFALLPFPLVAWLALATSISASMTSLLIMSVILFAATSLGTGYFYTPDPYRTALSIDGFVSLLCLSTLVIGTLQRGRLRLEALTGNALKGARIALWEWHPGRGLILHDAGWAAYFRAKAGEPVQVAWLKDAIEAETPLSVLCDPRQAPAFEVGAQEDFRLKLPDGTWRSLRCCRLPEPPLAASLRNTYNGILLDLTEQIEAQALREEAVKREVELHTLKVSIHPHFLFNSLNTLRSLIASRPQEAREFVTRLANFLRGSLSYPQQNLVHFGDELAMVKNYLGIERFRFDERMRVQIQVSPAAHSIPFPPMILQTLVENAAKYGVARRAEGGEITIEARLDGGRLRVLVTNDGPLVETPTKSTGVGLRNSRERLQLLYGDQASLTLKEIEGPRVQAEVTVPIKDHLPMMPKRV